MFMCIGEDQDVSPGGHSTGIQADIHLSHQYIGSFLQVVYDIAEFSLDCYNKHSQTLTLRPPPLITFSYVQIVKIKFTLNR